MAGHSLYIASTKDDEFIKQLPQPISDDRVGSSSKKDSKDLKIAWRYEDVPQVQSSMATGIKYGHYYDISKTMDLEMVNQTEINYLNVSKSTSTNENKYVFTTKHLSNYISNNNKDIATAVKSGKTLQILRVGLSSIGNPFWQQDNSKQANSAQDIRNFLMSLRITMRKSLAVCCVSIPAMRLYSESDQRTFRQLSDISVYLESFKDGKPNPLFKDYHGMSIDNYLI